MVCMQYASVTGDPPEVSEGLEEHFSEASAAFDDNTNAPLLSGEQEAQLRRAVRQYTDTKRTSTNIKINEDSVTTGEPLLSPQDVYTFSRSLSRLVCGLCCPLQTIHNLRCHA